MPEPDPAGFGAGTGGMRIFQDFGASYPTPKVPIIPPAWPVDKVVVVAATTFIAARFKRGNG